MKPSGRWAATRASGSRSFAGTSVTAVQGPIGASRASPFIDVLASPRRSSKEPAVTPTDAVTPMSSGGMYASPGKT